MRLSYKKTISFLESFVNYEKYAAFGYKKSFKLERVRNLFKKLKINPKALRTVHVAGTKGKGSTATFLSFILASCGYKVGLYTSPHFDDFRERIKIIKTKDSRPKTKDQKIESKLISQREVVSLVNKIRPVAEKLRCSRKSGRLSFFEVYTALAFKYFLERKVDFAVLECGLGGRLDATNLCLPDVSVITHIGFDHTQQLGNSLTKISREKAGVIKSGIPVVCARQKDTSLKVLKLRARKSRSPLYIYGRDFSASNIRLTRISTSFDIASSLGSLRDLKIGLKGRHQAENASLAVFSYQLLRQRRNLKKDCFRQGLKEAEISGRFQIIEKNKNRFLLDIAHNPSSIKVLNSAIKDYFPSEKIVLIFGCSRDKDVKNMLKNIKFDNIILTRADHPRAYEPGQIKEICGLRRCFLEDELKAALRKALKISKPKDLIVITGSFFLVAQARHLIHNGR